jgi:hypothetical protein
MPIIPVRQLKPGMTLESPVTNFLGNVLLKSGVSISQKHIATFMSWGVKNVTVQGKISEELPHQDEIKPSDHDIVRNLDHLFSTVQHQPVMRMMQDIAKQQALKPRSSS